MAGAAEVRTRSPTGVGVAAGWLRRASWAVVAEPRRVAVGVAAERPRSARAVAAESGHPAAGVVAVAERPNPA